MAVNGTTIAPSVTGARDPGSTTEAPDCVLVAGASGGIGHALCQRIAQLFPAATIIRMARSAAQLPALPAATLDIDVDIADETRIEKAVATIPDNFAIDWVLVATGWLHDEGRGPEKTYRQLDADAMLHAYRINAIGPALLIKHLIPRLHPNRPCRIGILSARVGSISDNRLGGWHSYRASKAALNMLIKNYAIELGRKRRDDIIVGLQPGTTDTALSAPFQRNVPEGHLQSPEFTAEKLVGVMQGLVPANSGGLFDFLGLPFEP